MKKVIVTLLSGIVFFIILTIFSKDVFPGSSLYNFKRVYEKAIFLSKSEPSQKAEFYSDILDIRLSELQHAYKYKVKHFYILSSSLRYSTTAGEATQYIVNNNLTDKSMILKRKLEKHEQLIGKMANEYKGFDDNASFFQDAVNYINIYKNTLDKFCVEKKCSGMY